MPNCCLCNNAAAQLRRPKTNEMICKPCFFDVFENEIHQTITEGKLFERGENVAIGVSGGKDSTVLAYIMKKLNDKHDYGLNLFMLSIDEGIIGYRDDSLETVKRNKEQYQLPLKIVSYKELYGWTMDEIVQQIGLKNNCSFCGIFRRQALDRGAWLLNAQKVITGHNADDLAETILMNILRGDISRLQRCASIMTDPEGSLPRAKPFKYTYQKEIVMYAYFKKLDYFSTECLYAPQAYRGHARDFLKDLESIRTTTILDIIKSAENFHFDKENIKAQMQTNCIRCGYITSQPICRACVLLEGLNKGKARLALGENLEVALNNEEKQRLEEKRALNKKQPIRINFVDSPASTGDNNNNSTNNNNSHSNVKREYLNW